MIIDNRSLVALWHFDGNIGRQRLKALTIKFPAEFALQSRAGRQALGNVENFLAIITRIGKLGYNTFDAFKFIFVISKEGDIFILVLNQMN